MYFSVPIPDDPIFLKQKQLIVVASEAAGVYFLFHPQLK
jgi:hypothetical protein